MKFQTKMCVDLKSYCVVTLPCGMQTFKNDTDCAEITTKFYHVEILHMFNQLLTLPQNLLKMSQAHRCVCHSLIAGESFIFQTAGHGYYT